MKSQLYKLCVWLSVSDLFMPYLSDTYIGLVKTEIQKHIFILD